MAVKHYRKILVPLDGLDRAEAVLVHAITIARCSDGENILLRVPLYANGQEGSPALPAVHGYAPRPLKGDREKALEESRRYLNKVRTNLVRLGVKVFVPVQEGEAPPRIFEYAREANVDLVAMATHGRDGAPA